MNLAETLGKAVLSAIAKQGIFYEARNLDLEGSLPVDIGGRSSELKFSIKVEHMTLSLPAAGDSNNKDIVLIRTLVAAEMKQLRYGSHLAEGESATDGRRLPWGRQKAKDIKEGGGE